MKPSSFTLGQTTLNQRVTQSHGGGSITSTLTLTVITTHLLAHVEVASGAHDDCRAGIGTPYVILTVSITEVQNTTRAV